MKWNFSIQNNGLMSKIKQPNKNWINDHNFNKDLTFKIMEKKKYRKTNVPFNCQQPWLLGSSIPCRDSSSSLRRHILPRRVIVSLSRPRRVNFTESSLYSSYRMRESLSLRWVRKRFLRKFSGQCNMVIFICLAPLTDLYSFWYGLKDLFTLHKLADKTWWHYKWKKRCGSAPAITGGSWANGLKESKNFVLCEVFETIWNACVLAN